MPLCTCGCNQNITRRAIQNHLRGRTVPRLVTALVKSYQTFGPISPPRLNPSKKLRSSRRYFPSSPTLANFNDKPDMATSEVDIAERDRAMHSGNEAAIILDDEGFEHAVNAAREDVWSGLHHDDGDGASDYDENEDGEGGDGGGSNDDSDMTIMAFRLWT